MAKSKSSEIPFSSTQIVGALLAVAGTFALAYKNHLAAIAMLLAAGLLVLPTENKGPNAGLFKAMRTVGLVALGFYAVYILVGLASTMGTGY